MNKIIGITDLPFYIVMNTQCYGVEFNKKYEPWYWLLLFISYHNVYLIIFQIRLHILYFLQTIASCYQQVVNYVVFPCFTLFCVSLYIPFIKKKLKQRYAIWNSWNKQIKLNWDHSVISWWFRFPDALCCLCL